MTVNFKHYLQIVARKPKPQAPAAPKVLTPAELEQVAAIRYFFKTRQRT